MQIDFKRKASSQVKVFSLNRTKQKKRNEEKDGKITYSISNVLSTRSCYSKYGFSEIYYGGVGHLHVGTYLSLK